MVDEIRTLRSGFLRASETFASRPALEVGKAPVTFRELHGQAASLAATLQRRAPANDPPLTAIFAYRSITAFAGILGALYHGHGYVPLNRRFPPTRTRTMLERSGCRSLIADSESASQLDLVLEGLSESLLILLPEQQNVQELAARWPRHTILGAQDLVPAEAWEPQVVSPDAVAYLLFTSGSTGTPKGVAVAHRNVLAFIDVMAERYRITEEDRFSQVFDMTFDLSAFDMFVAWERGACVCCPSQKMLIKPDGFIRDARLTIWFSVPSTAMFMKRLGVLKPDQYPTLRWSLFCGEPLPVDLAKAWTEAAPQSIVENLYGPTELTIACTLYRWDKHTSDAESLLGIVPIGSPYPGMQTLIVDESLQEVPSGAEGELLMTGPQLTLGYWRDPEKTAASFVIPSGKDTLYYRTGDRVRRMTNTQSQPLVYVGRVDHQIKVLGYRVELGEVEAAVRIESGADTVVALGWPVSASGADGIVAFMSKATPDAETIIRQLKSRLPSYMVPHKLYPLSEFPLNSNGKVDRTALFKMLETSL